MAKKAATNDTVDTTASAPAAAEPETQAIAVKPQAGLATKPPASEDVIERVKDAIEALESFSSISLPMIRFKEGFTLSEGEEEIEGFEGVIIYTKESNVYYKKAYRPGEKALPDCYSPDGKFPTSETPQATSCAACKHNQFGSSPTGDGKACKNVRPIYVLVRNPETGEFGIIPKMLRVPPTSLVLIKAYIMNLATDYGSYYAVRTKFSVFQRSENQTHYNIKFSTAGRLTGEERANINFIRDKWMDMMRAAQVDLPGDEEKTAQAPTAAPEGATPSF